MTYNKVHSAVNFFVVPCPPPLAPTDTGDAETIFSEDSVALAARI